MLPECAVVTVVGRGLRSVVEEEMRLHSVDGARPGKREDVDIRKEVTRWAP